MTIHSFGATFSPFCSDYAHHHLVNDFVKVYSDIACEATLNVFYIDDHLVSVSSTGEAKNLIVNLSTLLTKADLQLRN